MGHYHPCSVCECVTSTATNGDGSINILPEFFLMIFHFKIHQKIPENPRCFMISPEKKPDFLDYSWFFMLKSQKKSQIFYWGGSLSPGSVKGFQHMAGQPWGHHFGSLSWHQRLLAGAPPADGADLAGVVLQTVINYLAYFMMYIYILYIYNLSYRSYNSMYNS